MSTSQSGHVFANGGEPPAAARCDGEAVSP